MDVAPASKFMGEMEMAERLVSFRAPDRLRKVGAVWASRPGREGLRVELGHCSSKQPADTQGSLLGSPSL